MKGLSAVLLFTLLALPAAASQPPAEGDRFEPSAELSELLSARGEGDEALIGSEERDYFDALPARAKELIDGAVESELISEASHLVEILSLGLPATKLELLMRDNCALCHTDPASQDPETLFSSDEDMADEIYDRWPEAPERHEDRTWIPAFCARCHADPVAMRRFDPSLPTDQYAKYKESMHGRKLLDGGDSKAAQCVSCHGAHGIRGPSSPRSSVHPQRIPYTCGRCHGDAEYMEGYMGSDGERLPTDQLEEFESSVHGRALLDRSDLGAPACNDCHGNHAAMPPEVSSVAQVCRTCHAGNGELFDGSKHKDAFERHEWPECEVCHGNHAIAETEDSMLSEASDPLCYECHREYAEDNPDCARTAKYFYTSITTVAGETESLGELVHGLAEKGLDVDPLAATVEELEDILRQSRSGIHAFDRGEFEKVERRGREGIEKGWQLVAEAEEEYQFRRRGLFAAVGIMIFLTAVIYLKIREIESHE
jgi:predicted CXXCH cytochrome family protein